LTETLKRTALYEAHINSEARLVPFAGWEMPLQYTGILNETKAVRNKGGIFDVSHMGRSYIWGPQATQLMEWIQTGSIGNLRDSRARYSLVCNEEGGIIDDTVTYRLEENSYLLVCNASNREAVMSWINHWRSQRFPDTHMDDVTLQTVMIAIQGPAVAQLMDSLCDSEPSGMRFFSSMETRTNGLKSFLGRTGYTGEDGFEVIVDATDGSKIWQTLTSNGMTPCGLGSRDVLRLEAGLALHGSDIDLTTSPLEAGLDRFVQLEKEFASAPVLRKQRDDGINRKLIGLTVKGRNIPRHNYPIVHNNSEVGHVTSGSYSPTLDTNIAMGYVSTGLTEPNETLHVNIRGRLVEASITQLPFYSRKRTS
jgi:aminomethyltransferase